MTHLLPSEHEKTYLLDGIPIMSHFFIMSNVINTVFIKTAVDQYYVYTALVIKLLQTLIVPRANSLKFILTAITMEKTLHSMITLHRQSQIHVHISTNKLSKKPVLAPDKMYHAFMSIICNIKSFLSYSNLLQLLSF